MPEPIVSFDAIQRRAQEAATVGHCPQTACPWPLGSAAGLAFQLEFHAQQALQCAAREHEEVTHDNA